MEDILFLEGDRTSGVASEDQSEHEKEQHVQMYSGKNMQKHTDRTCVYTLFFGGVGVYRGLPAVANSLI